MQCKTYLKSYLLKGVFLTFFFFISVIWTAHSQPLQWKVMGNLSTPRHYFCALAFSSQEILVMGGWTGGFGPLSGYPTNSCEIIDLRNNITKSASPMLSPRSEFVALLTKDSNIVVISGYNTPSVEMYDRAKGTWKSVGYLLEQRRQHVAQFISNNEILITGGVNGNNQTVQSSEIFNLSTGVSRRAADYPVPINIASAEISSTGKLLVTAGRLGGGNSQRNQGVYAYDQNNNSWDYCGQIPAAVVAASILKLWDGRIFLSGGSSLDGPPGAKGTCSIESNNKFSVLPSLKSPRLWHSSAQWSPNYALIFGGLDYYNNEMPLSSTELFAIPNSTISPGPALIEARKYFCSVSLPIRGKNNQYLFGRVVVISGLNSSEINTKSIEILEEDTSKKNDL